MCVNDREEERECASVTDRERERARESNLLRRRRVSKGQIAGSIQKLVPKEISG